MNTKLRKILSESLPFGFCLVIMALLTIEPASAGISKYKDSEALDKTTTEEVADGLTLQIEEATKRDSTTAIFGEITEGEITYISIDTNSVGLTQETQILDFDVNFPAAGSYDLYIKFKIGPEGLSDDSFYASPSLGKTSVGASWVVVNALSERGYDSAHFVVEGAGTVADSLWRWINVTQKEGSLSSFEIGEAGRQVWSFGARENGLAIDKIAFAPTGKTVEELENLPVATQNDLSEEEEPVANIQSIALEIEEATTRDSITNYFSEISDQDLTYYRVDTSRNNLDTTAQIIDFDVNFLDAGDYDIYIRFKVGPEGTSDDSFFASPTFGKRQPWESWVTVNQLSGIGYHEDEMIVGGGGTAPDSVWRWVNITVKEASLNALQVQEAGRKIWSFGSRENGLMIDKIVFASSGKTVAELDSTAISPQEDLSQEEEEPQVVLTSIALDIEDATKRDAETNFFSENTQGELTYFAVDSQRVAVDTIAQIIDFDVNFIDTGSYHLYIRYKIGNEGVADDSFFASPSFGKGVVGGAWSVVNQLSGLGYASPSDIVGGAGSAVDSTWRWIDITAKEGSLAAFEISEAGQKIWSFASREDGFMIDKIVFGSPGRSVAELDTIAVSEQSDVSQVDEEGIGPAKSAVSIEFEDAVKRDVSTTLFDKNTSGKTTYLTVNETYASVESEVQILDFEVNFTEKGIYNLYVRFNVGFEGVEDDSFFASQAFGKTNVEGSWSTVNQLSGEGYDTGVVGGAAGENTADQTWKWVNVTARQNMTAFVVEEAGVVNWSFASRENGLSLDKIVFAAVGKTAEELDALGSGKDPNDTTLSTSFEPREDIWVYEKRLYIANVSNLEGQSLNVVDLSGKVLLKREIAKAEKVIDLSFLPEGVYVIRTADITKRVILR